MYRSLTMNKKTTNRFIILAILCGLLVLLLVQPTYADQPSSTKEAADWTKDKVNAFLTKYNIGYDKHLDESALARKVQEYEKYAKTNANYFGAKIDHYLNNVKINLQEQRELSQHDVEGVLADIQHRLRQLELQGQLTRDKVDQAVDKAQRKLANKKTLSESFWKQLKNDVGTQFTEAYYQPKSWYQRIFSTSTTSSVKSTAKGAKSSIDQWLDHVEDRLREAGILTEHQLQAIREQLRQQITSTKLHKLASPHWYQKLYHRLEKRAKLTEHQAEQVRETLEQEINAYKVFASDYIGTKMDHSKEWMQGMYHYCCQAVSTARSKLENWISYVMARFHDSVKALQHKQQKQVKDLEATQKAWKRDFDRYWQHKHLEAYRRLGYSEAQIDHIKKSLAKAMADQQSNAQRNVDQGWDSLKQYMQDARVQTSSQIQTEIDRMKKQLDELKKKVKVES